jgi:hypothetical protein
MDELAADVEEWRYDQLGQNNDPADLPERDFSLFVQGVVSLAQVYRRLSRTVHEELVPILQADLRTSQSEREIERFERAFRRLSRVMLSIATPAIEQRIERMEREEKPREYLRNKSRAVNNTRRDAETPLRIVA